MADNREDLTGNVNGDGVPTCGTDDTPPCPLYAFYIERNKLIYELAGPCPDERRVADVASRVDRYLIAALRGVHVLTHERHDHRDRYGRYEQDSVKPE